MTNEEEREWKWDHLMMVYDLEQVLDHGNADGRTLYLAERCGLGNDFKLYLEERKNGHAHK